MSDLAARVRGSRQPSARKSGRDPRWPYVPVIRTPHPSVIARGVRAAEGADGMSWSWVPVAILAVLVLGMVVALALDLRHDWRRVDPLTMAQLDRAVAEAREREGHRG